MVIQKLYLHDATKVIIMKQTVFFLFAFLFIAGVSNAQNDKKNTKPVESVKPANGTKPDKKPNEVSKDKPSKPGQSDIQKKTPGTPNENASDRAREATSKDKPNNDKDKNEKVNEKDKDKAKDKEKEKNKNKPNNKNK